jgi:glutamine amidotransferase
MKPSVTVVDYGMGNILSVTRALEHCGAEVTLESDPSLIANSPKLVLPGVGAFGDGMAELQQRGLVEALRGYAASGRPLLGICLGMQMLLDGSDEFGASDGLGLIPGWVRKLPEQPGIKLPHIGWSAILPPQGISWEVTLLENVPAGHEMYFVHSFHADPTNSAHRLAETRYGDYDFCSVVKKDNITGCQFHPEKSGEMGLGIIRNFLRASA